MILQVEEEVEGWTRNADQSETVFVDQVEWAAGEAVHSQDLG